MGYVRVAVEGRGRGKSLGGCGDTLNCAVLKGGLWWRELWPQVSAIATADGTVLLLLRTRIHYD